MTNERDCEHGNLRRACRICELEAENKELRSRLGEVLADRSAAREHLQRERDRADEAEARIIDLLRGGEKIIAERDAALLRLGEALSVAARAHEYIGYLHREKGSGEPGEGLLVMSALARLQPVEDGPGEEDGPWAEGWASRCGIDPARPDPCPQCDRDNPPVVERRKPLSCEFCEAEGMTVPERIKHNKEVHDWPNWNKSE